MPLVVRNPADRRIVLGTMETSTSEDVRRAVDAAEDGFARWSAVPLKERREALASIADVLEGKKEELAKTLVAEVGKPVREARGEVASAISTVRHYAALAFEDRVLVREGISYAYLPYGVCALILPWNYPLLLMCWKAAPALLAGNSIVLKPSEYTPMTDSLALEIMRPRLPPGTMEMVYGGDAVGKELVQHPKVRRIAFTGAASTGPKVLREASNHISHVTLELGGNDPAIVLPDIDLSRRFEALFWSAFRNAGQVCIAVKRLYVHHSIYEEVVQRFAARGEQLRIGNPAEPETEMGAVNNQAQMRTVSRLVRDARQRGGTVRTGGHRLRGALRHGLFYKPAIVTGLDNAALLVQEEQFGPALPILQFQSVDEAVEMANDSSLALGASVWSEDMKKAREIAEQLDAGIVWINTHMHPEISAPFGGMKRSGIGRELGIHGLMEYLVPKTYVMRG
ncbi:MAG: aldehyde dehydrogenase family protein [Candidatus Thermoplasmatota archaeon]